MAATAATATLISAAAAAQADILGMAVLAETGLATLLAQQQQAEQAAAEQAEIRYMQAAVAAELGCLAKVQMEAAAQGLTLAGLGVLLAQQGATVRVA